MNWLNNFIRPKIRSIVGQKDVPDNLWQKCPSCEGMLFHRDLAENMNVCTHCGHHLKISVTERLNLLFDGAYKRIDIPNVAQDPLKFKDKKKYVDRLKDAQSKTGEKDAIIVAEGEIGGMPAVVAAFNFDFMGGSMGAAVGEGIVRAAETAVAKNAALIAIPASGGARMQEGMVSLIQLPRSVIAVRMVKDAGLPYIVLLTDPTTGGVSASFAMLGDIHMAEPGCMIGFAGKRVIEETIREQLPAGFQTAEYLRDHGMVDMVVARKDLKESMGRVLNLLMNRTGTLNKQGNGGTASSGKANGGKAGLFAGKTAFAPHTTVNQLTPANDPVDVAPAPANVSKRAAKK
ncbi:MAG TPA: acetyl-CoA carboxylase carboxyl transferase subunit beta [Rhodospirillaceae bacterium]|nr:acetyl-CoA carboxylase carboxyl transferase subunit beta [Rhodospirillaceae bacterium]